MANLLNHSEIIEIYKASRECIWLRSIIQHIKEKYKLLIIKNTPIILFEEDKTKHISPKFFFILTSFIKRKKLIQIYLQSLYQL